jgi:hypothetical protein
MAVTARPLPMGTEPIDVPTQSSGSRRMPADSPGTPTPVGDPNPNSRR